MKKKKILYAAVSAVVLAILLIVVFLNGENKQKVINEDIIEETEINTSEEAEIESVMESMSSSKSETGSKYNMENAKKVYLLEDRDWYADTDIKNFDSIITDEVCYMIPSEDKSRYYTLKKTETDELEWIGTATPSKDNKVSFASLTDAEIERAVKENTGKDASYAITYSESLDCIFIWISEEKMIIPFCDEGYVNGLLSEKAYTYKELTEVLNKEFH